MLRKEGMIRNEGKLATRHGKGIFEVDFFGNGWHILPRGEIPAEVRES